MTASAPPAKGPVAVSPVRGAAALSGAELRLLLRNRMLVFTALVMPLLLGLFLGLNAETLGPAGTPALQLVVVLALAVYGGAATALTARRQDTYLKRLRSGELGDTTVLAGLLLPWLLLGTVQAAVLAAAAVAFGTAPPAGPALVALGVLGGSAMFCVAAAATSGLTRTPETAQITTLPLLLTVVAGTFWSLTNPATEVTARMLAVPGAGIAQLVRLGWLPPEPGAAWWVAWWVALPAFGATAAWTAVAVLAATRTFRWDPRS